MEPKELSEDELFLSGDEPEEIETETPEPQAELEPVKDEDGDQPEPVKAENADTDQASEGVEVEKSDGDVQAETEQKEEAVVPSWRLREINEAKAAAEAQLIQEREAKTRLEAELSAIRRQTQQQQTQQPEQLPDIFENPDGFIEYQRQQMAEIQRQNALHTAKVEAYAIHGYETVEGAYKAALEIEHTNPGVAQRIMAAPNPWAEAVSWHKEVQTQKEIGEGGIDGFRERLKSEIMADPEFRKSVFEEMRSKAGVAPKKENVGVVPSLNEAPATAVTGTANEREMSEEELFRSA